MELRVEDEGSEGRLVHSFILGSREIAIIDKQEKKVFIPYYKGLLVKDYLEVAFKDIEEMRISGVSNTVDQGSFVGYGVKIITDKIDYLVGINCRTPNDAEKVLKQLETHIS